MKVYLWSLLFELAEWEIEENFKGTNVGHFASIGIKMIMKFIFVKEKMS